ncbi:hypothetical protein [Burkholderia cenocepacia]|uniref:hypothetical protein n=1 Tax=Burkholderia cenocepacia TaxID=95486 RepID=UPI0013A53D8A|nr:hypothetical protein [Burkholderia cenocepacia]HEM7887690.1 hypothetical protein [Burkholderia cenocepacia]
MTRLAEDGNLIEIKTIRIELHIFETFEPVRPHGWFRMRRMAGMAADALTHLRFTQRHCRSESGGSYHDPHAAIMDAGAVDRRGRDRHCGGGVGVLWGLMG